MDAGRPRAWAGVRRLRATERLRRDLDRLARVHAARDLTKARVQGRCSTATSATDERRRFNAIAAFTPALLVWLRPA
jgi:hypothetical protein